MRSLLVGWFCGIGLCCAAAAGAGESAKIRVPTSANPVGNFLKRLGLPDEHERSHLSVRSVFREIVAPAGQATVRVINDDEQASLGLVVDARGYVLTKASEVAQGRLECVLSDRRRLEATRIARRDDLDLALLKIPATALSVVPWSDAPAPQIGSWLATPNIQGEPTAIGVVSTVVHPIPSPQPVLGVELEVAERGVRVFRVHPGYGADRAGVRSGDIITTINGVAADTPAALINLIQSMNPGDKVTLSINRAGQSYSVAATLGDKSRAGKQDQAELMDSLGGPLSRRRAGFASVLQHDTVLRPRDCGGPVVDLDGKVVGVNIARASRVASYALPANVVRPVVLEMLNAATESRPGEHPVATNP